MPELPEVETVARTLLPHVINNLILSVTVLRPNSLHNLSLPPDNLIGCKITNVRRRAKLLILNLMPPAPGGPDMLIIHLRMTGRLYVSAPECNPATHTRCWFLLLTPANEKQCLFFDDVRTFGKLFICRQDMLTGWDFWRELGPEPLSLPKNGLAARLKGKRPVKTALLDQKVIAGLGNIYVDEALFAAGILPVRPADSITGEESEKLLAVLKKILNRAILKKGSSIRDYRDADGNTGNFQKEFSVYGRGGQPCKICGKQLESIKVGGRSTVYCSTCQK